MRASRNRVVTPILALVVASACAPIETDVVVPEGREDLIARCVESESGLVVEDQRCIERDPSHSVHPFFWYYGGQPVVNGSTGASYLSGGSRTPVDGTAYRTSTGSHIIQPGVGRSPVVTPARVIAGRGFSAPRVGSAPGAGFGRSGFRGVS